MLSEGDFLPDALHPLHPPTSFIHVSIRTCHSLSVRPFISRGHRFSLNERIPSPWHLGYQMPTLPSLSHWPLIQLSLTKSNRADVCASEHKPGILIFGKYASSCFTKRYLPSYSFALKKMVCSEPKLFLVVFLLNVTWVEDGPISLSSGQTRSGDGQLCAFTR